MNDYTKCLGWAVFYMIDRSTQDGRRSKAVVSALFHSPIDAEDNYIPHLPNKEIPCYMLPVDEVERFEEFYNHVQDLNEDYGDYAIFFLNDGNKFSVDELNRFRPMLNIYVDTKSF